MGDIVLIFILGIITGVLLTELVHSLYEDNRK